jgi:cell division septation protein DedD
MVVQVASTRDEAEAKRLVATLKGQGHAAFYERADLGAKGVWYRVTTGPYADRNAADKAAVQLKQQKYSTMVRAR